MAASHSARPDDSLLPIQPTESDEEYVWLDEKEHQAILPKVDNTAYVHLYNGLKFICPSYMLDLEEQRFGQALRSHKRPAVISFLKVIEKIQKEVKDDQALQVFTKALEDLVEGAKRARREHKSYLQVIFQKLGLLVNFFVPGIAQVTTPVADYLAQVPQEVKKDGDELMEHLLSASGVLEQIILVTTLALQAKKVGANLVELQRKVGDIKANMTIKYPVFKVNFDIYAEHIIKFMLKIEDERPKDKVIQAPAADEKAAISLQQPPVEAKRIPTQHHHDTTLADKADAKTVTALQDEVASLKKTVHQLNAILVLQEAKLTASTASFAETMANKDSKMALLTSKLTYVQNTATIRQRTATLRIESTTISANHRTLVGWYADKKTFWQKTAALSCGYTAYALYIAGGLTAALSGPPGWVLAGANIVTLFSSYTAWRRGNCADRLNSLDAALCKLELSVSRVGEIKGNDDATVENAMAHEEYNKVALTKLLRSFILNVGYLKNSVSQNCLDEIKLLIQNYNSPKADQPLSTINGLKTDLYNKLTTLADKEKKERYCLGLFPHASDKKFLDLIQRISDSEVFADQKRAVVVAAGRSL